MSSIRKRKKLVKKWHRKLFAQYAKGQNFAGFFMEGRQVERDTKLIDELTPRYSDVVKRLLDK